MVIVFAFSIYITNSRTNKLKRLKKVQNQIDDLINPDKMFEKLKIDIIQVRISDKLVDITDKKLMTQIAVLRVKLIERLGYMIPLVRGLDWLELQPYEYQFFIREKESEKGIVYPDRLMFLKLDLHNLPIPEDIIQGINPLDKTEVYWIKEGQTKEYENIKRLAPCEVIIQHLENICIKNADKIITLEYIQKLLDHIENKVYENNLIPSLISIIDLQKILINLVNRKVSIKDITYILEKLADYARYTKNIEELTEKIISDLTAKTKLQ